MARVVLRGRAEHTATLSAVLTQAVDCRRSALVVIEGAPGMGKSALLSSTVDAAEMLGFRVGTSKTDEIDQIALGAPLLVALRSGRTPLVDAAAFESLAPLYDKYVWLVERIALILDELAASGPILIAIDDIQWADPLTRFALRILPSRLADAPIVWALSSRHIPYDAAHEVMEAAADLLPVTRLPLQPLPATAIEELARDRLGTVPVPAMRNALLDTGGSPYWAVQVLDGFARHRATGVALGDLPPDLGRSVRRRLESVTPDARALVELVCVWGRGLALPEAGELLGLLPGTALRAAENAEDNGLVVLGDGSVRVPHDLLREALYREIPSDERASLHLRCARHLDGRPGSALTAAAHYRHCAAPGDVEASQAILRAATESINGAPEQASSLALEALELVPEGHTAWLPTGQAVLDLLVQAQCERDAVIVADRLIALSPDDESTAQLQVQASRALWESGSCDEMVHRCDAGLSLLEVSATTRVRLAAVRALAETRLDSALSAPADAHIALAEARSLEDPVATRVALHALSEAARNSGDHQAAYDYLRQVRSTSAYAHVAEEVRALQHLDRYDEADALLARLLHDGGNDMEKMLPAVQWVQMWQDHNMGRLEAAEADALVMLRATQISSNYTFEMNARMILCAVSIYRGDFVTARAALSPANHRAEADDQLRTARLRAVWAWLLGEEGDVKGSLELLRPLLAMAGDGRSNWVWAPPWMTVFARIAVAGGDRSVLRQTRHLSRLAAERNPNVASLQGVAHQVAGLVDNNVSELRLAVEVLRRGPRPLLLADALADLGAALLKGGQPASAALPLEEASTLLKQLGVIGRARQTDALLSSLAADRAQKAVQSMRPTGGWASLTEAELRVARLVARGHSSRDLANTLVVSINTVNTHMRSIFNKLEIHSRVQLVNVIHDQEARVG